MGPVTADVLNGGYVGMTFRLSTAIVTLKLNYKSILLSI